MEKTIVEFFNNIYGIDVSSIDYKVASIDANGLFDSETNEITISDRLSGSSFESTLVHEINHYIQHVYDLGLSIKATNLRELHKADDNSYDNRVLEIDSRIVQTLYEYEYISDVSAEFMIEKIVFMGGLTDNLFNAISNLEESYFKELLIAEWIRRECQSNKTSNSVSDIEFEAAIDELIATLD